jgi:predicted O-linked N-acetylglucosamine transferase (SPINDLY family)
MFDIWMRLLREVEGVLWLLENVQSGVEFGARSASARRRSQPACFAPLRNPEKYLARMRLADLFLDTLPYNAHTTASDALWMGLPLVTYPRQTFQSRVAASLLKAVGLPQLVTDSLAGYEELALALARNPERLAAIRAKLRHNRDTEPIFDTARSTRALESAYTMMWERQQAGLPPASFSVPDAL